MTETLRLDNTVACPACYYQVKPFVLIRENNGLEVQCPRDDCKEQFVVVRIETDDQET